MKNIDIILNNNCQLNCVFCNTLQFNGNNIDSQKNNILTFIQKIFIKGFESITFSGGEPTLDNNLFTYILFSKKLGFKKIKLQTNTILLENKYLDNIIGLGVNQIGFTYFGYNIETFGKITSFKDLDKFNNYLKFLNTIQKYNTKIDFTVDIVLNEFIISNLKQHINFLKTKGINHINFKMPFSMKSQKLNYDLKKYCDELLTALKDVELGYSLIYFPTCYLDYLEDKIYDFTNDYIYDGIFFSLEDSIKKLYFKTDDCLNCKKYNNCYGFEKVNKLKFTPNLISSWINK